GQGSVLHGELGLEAQALLLQGRVAEAVRVADAATDAALSAGNDQLLVWTLHTAATAAIWAGYVDHAIFSARQTDVLADPLGAGSRPPRPRGRRTRCGVRTGPATRWRRRAPARCPAARRRRGANGSARAPNWCGHARRCWSAARAARPMPSPASCGGSGTGSG